MSTPHSSSEIDGIVNDFLVESREGLDQVDRDLVALEQEPSNLTLISGIFRTIHTIKGTCGFLGYQKLESLTHVGENLLSKLREGQLKVTPEIATALLVQVDAIRGMLNSIEEMGNEGSTDYSNLVAQIVALQEPKQNNTPEALDHVESDVMKIGNVLTHTKAATEEQVAAALAAQQKGDRRLLGEIMMEQAGVTAEQVNEALQIQQQFRSRGGQATSRASSVAATGFEQSSSKVQDSKGGEGSIRVDVDLLDKLMNQVGELVLARNQILQFASHFVDQAFLSTTQRLNQITTELQEGVMKTRMQPIGNICGKFPRVVRDLARQCCKKVRFEMEGSETELDKTIVEAIKDPLTHLVRNSIDHGIETPDVRLAAGKQEEGCLSIRAFHEGGQVNIEIRDDGGGLNLERIRQRALERGLISAEQAARMNDREISMLIFMPGFSTAQQVTNVSGRGVGMDVVKTNVEKIGGSVDIQSVTGKGTTIKLKIPLTLAIIPALIVSCSGDRFAIPQVNLLELVRLEGEHARTGIERLHDAPVYRLRGQLLPIVYLQRELGLSDRGKTTSDDGINIVVLQADGKQFGIVVDAINDSEEIVVKPLGKQLKGISVYAGATIMGDGRVALIVDVLGMAQRARIVNSSRQALPSVSNSQKEGRDARQHSLLVVNVGERRLAVPISQVSRLEEIAPHTLEKSDQGKVIRYRGDILPLIDLGESLGIPRAPQSADQPLNVVVYEENGKGVGFLVDKIADVVDAAMEVNRASKTPGLSATTIIQDRVTDLLNVRAIIRKSDPSFFQNNQPA